MTVTVYRIQPQGADLHGVETETSNGKDAGGVHVFETIPEVYACREWRNERGVELAEIECDADDLCDNGDYEGALLPKGRGRIVRRRRFADVRQISQWVEAQL
jgi:hypothetical protein